MSSHVLSDLEAICDHVVFIEAGRCVQSGPLSAVTGRQRVVRYTLGPHAPDLDALRTRLAEFELSYAGGTLLLEASSDADIAAVNRRVLPALLELGADVIEVRVGQSLEQAYLDGREEERRT